MSKIKKTKKKVARKDTGQPVASGKNYFLAAKFSTALNQLIVKKGESFLSTAKATGLTMPTMLAAVRGEKISLNSYAALCIWMKHKLDDFIIKPKSKSNGKKSKPKKAKATSTEAAA